MVHQILKHSIPFSGLTSDVDAQMPLGVAPIDPDVSERQKREVNSGFASPESQL